MSLQDHHKQMAESLPHQPMPKKVLAISDLHGGRGWVQKIVSDENGQPMTVLVSHDPLLNSGLEPKVIALLLWGLDNGYALWISEAWDMWRGYGLEFTQPAHPGLTSLLDQYKKRGDLFWAEGNHERDEISQPEAFVFEGFGWLWYLDHGAAWDWPNCKYWKMGRLTVRAADALSVDPETSPHPHPDPASLQSQRHIKVVQMRDALALANPKWRFVWGHTHEWRNHEVDPQCPANNFNDGSPIAGMVTYYQIDDGVVAGKEWK